MHGSHVVLAIVITVLLVVVIMGVSVAVGVWVRRKASERYGQRFQ